MTLIFENVLMSHRRKRKLNICQSELIDVLKDQEEGKKVAELSVICLVYRVNHTYVLCTAYYVHEMCGNIGHKSQVNCSLNLFRAHTIYLFRHYTVFQKQCNSNTNCVRFIKKTKKYAFADISCTMFFYKKHNPPQ